MGAGEWKVANYVVIHESESENNFYIISLCTQNLKCLRRLSALKLYNVGTNSLVIPCIILCEYLYQHLLHVEFKKELFLIIQQ